MKPGKTRETVVPRSRRFTQRFPAFTWLIVAIAASGMARSLPLAADSGWTVRTFDVTLDVRPDAAVDVTELIDANFEVAKHGIYREIPIRYAVGMQQYALRFRLLGVDDGAGQSYRTAVSYEENRVRIRIGSAAGHARTVPSGIAFVTACSGRSSGKGRAHGVVKREIAIMPFFAGTPRELSGACRSQGPR